MAMVFCRGCAKEIHETAPTCPQCGAKQYIAAPASPRSPWMAIVSLVFGILSALSLFDDAEWNNDTIVGLGVFSAIGLILGIINITQKRSGQNMAIVGIILSAISLLASIGLYNQ